MGGSPGGLDLRMRDQASKVEREPSLDEKACTKATTPGKAWLCPQMTERNSGCWS